MPQVFSNQVPRQAPLYLRLAQEGEKVVLELVNESGGTEALVANFDSSSGKFIRHTGISTEKANRAGIAIDSNGRIVVV